MGIDHFITVNATVGGGPSVPPYWLTPGHLEFESSLTKLVPAALWQRRLQWT